MANAGADATGLKELSALIDRLPDDVTAKLRSVALISANRIKNHARQILLSKQKTPAHALADAIEVIAEPEQQRYVVDSQGPPGQPKNLGLWVERGTRFMAARPYMRPAGDAEDEHYKTESIKAAESVVDRLGDI